MTRFAGTQESLDRIREEIRSFHNDLEGELRWTTLVGLGAEVEWVLGDVRHRATIRWSGRESDWVAELEDGTTLSYRALLASPRLGNLRTLAQRHQTRLSQTLGKQGGSSDQGNLIRGDLAEVYITPRIRLSNADLTEDVDGGGDALDVLEGLVSGWREDATTLLFFLISEAGQGKSRTLVEFCRGSAERFGAVGDRAVGADERFAFYIDAQGRGLGQLQEVLAYELNRLSVLLPYGSFVPLVRHGLVALVIDGFDELVGQAGSFNDAYTSLRDFLDDIGGGGVIVGAARMSYFAQDFLSRESASTRAVDAPSGAPREGRNYDLTSVGVLEGWKREQREEFVREVVARARLSDSARRKVTAAMTDLIAADAARERSLLARPLFCLSVLRIVLADADSDWVDRVKSNMDLVTREIVEAYIRREVTTKISEANRKWVSPRLLHRYYVEIAQEMWQLETRSIGAGDRIDSMSATQVLMEALCEEEKLPDDARRQLRQRANYLPMISFDERARSIKFDHELFFAHFAAAAITEALGSPTVARRLSKNQIDDDIALSIATEMLGTGKTPAAVQRVCAIAKVAAPMDAAMVRENCGRIVAALLSLTRARGGDLSELRVDSVDFRNTGLLSGVRAEGIRLTDVSFENVDLDGSELDGTADACSLGPIRIDEQTRLRLGGVEPSAVTVSLVRRQDGAGANSYPTPADLVRLFGREAPASAPPRRLPRDVEEVVEKMCRRLASSTLLRESDRYPHERFMQSPHWRAIIGAMNDAGLVEEEEPYSAAGPKRRVWRKRCDSGAVMRGYQERSDDPRIRKFWQLAFEEFADS